MSGGRAARSVRAVTATPTRSTFGPLLRQWRTRRRLSQLDLAVGSDVSARHISFLETGRSQPSREMVLRLSLHPDGLAGRIRNLAEWRGHVLGRLAREHAVTGDPRTRALLHELAALPGGRSPGPTNAVAVPLRMEVGGRELAFLSTVTTFGTAVDVTLAELSIEAFLPADAATAEAMAALVPGGG